MKLKVLDTSSVHPFYNQALEACLLKNVREEEVILYLWQNQRTVVIGKNQSAYGECDVSLLEKEGGHLARRTSGGGAVYHDLGNLNFTFVMPSALMDVEKEDEVILTALRDLDIDAYKNGRNDLLVGGRKFSGHAYYRGKEKAYHHGTLMVDVNEEYVSRYLNVSLKKLEKKAVKSVRSRIINLKEICRDLDIAELKEALIQSFETVYQGKAERICEEDLDQEEIRREEEFFSADDWRYGKERRTYCREILTDRGLIRMEYDKKEGEIIDPVYYTDSLDEDLLKNIEENKEIQEALMKEEERCMM